MGITAHLPGCTFVAAFTEARFTIREPILAFLLLRALWPDSFLSVAAPPADRPVREDTHASSYDGSETRFRENW